MENILQEYRNYLQSKINSVAIPELAGHSPKDEQHRLNHFNDAKKEFLDDAADKANTWLEDDDLLLDKDELREGLLSILDEYDEKFEAML